MRTRRERKSRKQAHELLTEAEKKANHIASEQKRRQNIRMGFDSLIDAVPTLNHGNRSEALILQKCKSREQKKIKAIHTFSQAIEHIHYLISVKNELKNQVRDLQSVLGDPYVTLNHDQCNSFSHVFSFFYSCPVN
jgi:type II secretory pathway component PulL